jgi:hypothetical protein
MHLEDMAVFLLIVKFIISGWCRILRRKVYPIVGRHRLFVSEG